MPDTTDDTDAQPTPGPWRPLGNGSGFWSIEPPDDAETTGAVVEVHAKYNSDGTVRKAEARGNARLIAAAGTAAQEAREMGYDPVAAVEALPELLKACQETAEQTPLYRQKAQDALASAEGSTDE